MAFTSKKSITLIAILGIVGLAFFFGFSSYNKIVDMDEGVQKAWGQVENQYQRRLDLIPNLVNTVKGYAKHEQETLTAVIEARSKVSQMKLDPSATSPEQLAEFANAQSALSSTLSKLMLVVERYPDLKANQNFLTLQAQLEGTENRISVERKRFNDAANLYNKYIRRFPQNIVASICSFEKRAYFEALPEAQKAPEVAF